MFDKNYFFLFYTYIVSIHLLLHEFYVFRTMSKVFVSEGSDFVRFQITIEREPLYFTFNVVLPILLLGLLNGFVFILPAESGERVGK